MCDIDGKLDGEKFRVVESLAAARPGGAFEINTVIEGIIARDILERSISPLVKILL